MGRNVDLRIVNRHDDGKATVGEMLMDGMHLCYTLEPSGDANFPAISAGVYSLFAYQSPRFHMTVPRLIVPGRVAIEIHPGNFPKDTKGCILVGDGTEDDLLESSRLAFDKMMGQLNGRFPLRLVVEPAQIIGKAAPTVASTTAPTEPINPATTTAAPDSHPAAPVAGTPSGVAPKCGTCGIVCPYCAGYYEGTGTKAVAEQTATATE